MSLTNRSSFKTAAGDGIVDVDGLASKGQNYIIDSNNAIVPVAPVYSIVFSAVSLIQLNAGLTLIPDIPGRTILPVGYLLIFNGTFLTSTDIRLQDSSGVLLATILIAAATAGAKISNEVVVANVTDGPGIYVALTAGKGIKIIQTGTAATGGISILVKLLYNVI